MLVYHRVCRDGLSSTLSMFEAWCCSAHPTHWVLHGLAIRWSWAHLGDENISERFRWSTARGIISIGNLTIQWVPGSFHSNSFLRQNATNINCVIPPSRTTAERWTAALPPQRCGGRWCLQWLQNLGLKCRPQLPRGENNALKSWRRPRLGKSAGIRRRKEAGHGFGGASGVADTGKSSCWNHQYIQCSVV